VRRRGKRTARLSAGADACQLQLGIAITKAALIRGERLGITGLKHLSDSTPSRRIVDDNEPPRLA
jgi:hypothetical protein